MSRRIAANQSAAALARIQAGSEDPADEAERMGASVRYLHEVLSGLGDTLPTTDEGWDAVALAADREEGLAADKEEGLVLPVPSAP